jgi:hypothetical protein
MWKLTMGLLAVVSIALSGTASGQAVYSGSDGALIGFPSSGQAPVYAQPPLANPPPQTPEPIRNFRSGAFDANTVTYGQRCSQAPIRPDIRASGTRYCY